MKPADKVVACVARVLEVFWRRENRCHEKADKQECKPRMKDVSSF